MDVVEIIFPVNRLGVTVKYMSLLTIYCSLQPCQVGVVEAARKNKQIKPKINITAGNICLTP
jgi:hypothetical protein